MTLYTVTIIGAGLAGSEAAWQLAQRDIKVKLYDMKPQKMSPAHKSTSFAELVCSNSFRSDDYMHNAVGLLHEEMRRCNSLIMQAADNTKVPAGGALAVDRDGFAKYVSKKIEEHPNIEIFNEEITQIPDNKKFENLANLTRDGYFDSDETTTTKTPGLFVAGDTRTKSLRQLVTATADGAIAATAAANYLDR